MATAASRMVSSRRMLAVRVEPAGIIERSVVVKMGWMSRWPAVRLAVGQTPKARGQMNRLVISIKISAGISKQ